MKIPEICRACKYRTGDHLYECLNCDSQDSFELDMSALEDENTDVSLATVIKLTHQDD